MKEKYILDSPSEVIEELLKYPIKILEKVTIRCKQVICNNV